MKYLKGVFAGLIIGLVVGGWAGFNKGRGAPLFFNPFSEYTIADRLKDNAGALYDDTRHNLQKSLE